MRPTRMIADAGMCIDGTAGVSRSSNLANARRSGTGTSVTNVYHHTPVFRTTCRPSTAGVLHLAWNADLSPAPNLL